MNNKEMKYKQYVSLLKKELVCALGCTEPIAVAYLASYAKQLLEEEVVEITLEVSGNVLKNVKSVIVPNTDKMKGIKVACVAGILYGEADRKLEVLSHASEANKKEIMEFMQNVPISLGVSTSACVFDLVVILNGKHHEVKVRIMNHHTNIVYASKDANVLIDTVHLEQDIQTEDILDLNVEDIVKFATEVNIDEVKGLLDMQIKCNMAIAHEGLSNEYGANIGKVLYQSYSNDKNTRAKAMAAAASDARMNGCEMPVVIVSGSGNQGITASVPVIVYAKEENYEQEALYRALLVSNLVTIHQKRGIGRLSAFCGVVSAGIGSGAGIAYLKTNDYNAVAHTIVNGLGVVSGMVCDGAKASCAAKIQSAVDAGLLGYYMYENKQEFKDGDGLIVKGVENTINNISQLAKEGMKETDQEIIKMMIKEC